MSEVLDAICYKNGNKNQWRRTAWNLLTEKTKDRANAVVLYLPGSTDLDRPEALRRGFKFNNLIAVERDAKVAAVLRQRGVPTIQGDLMSVLKERKLPRVDIVIADLVSGFDTTAGNLIGAWLLAYPDATFLINVQRGHDKFGADLINPINIERCNQEMEDGFIAGLPAKGKQRQTAVVSCFYLEIEPSKDTPYIEYVENLTDTGESNCMLDIMLHHKRKRFELAMAREKMATKNLVERAKQKKPLPTEKLLPLIKRLCNELRQSYDSPFFTFLPSYRSSPQSPWFDSTVISIPGVTAEYLDKHYSSIGI